MILSNIVFDSSALISENFPDLSAAFHQLSKFASMLGIKLYIPDIVVRELEQEFIENTLSSIHKIKAEHRKLKKVVREKIDISVPDIETLISEYRTEVENLIKNNGLVIIPVPSLRACDLIDKAVRRIPPFEVRDKGFKDAMIIESICEYGLNNKIKEFIFVSFDKVFENKAIGTATKEQGITLIIEKTVENVNKTIFEMLNKMEQEAVKEQEKRVIAFLNTQRHEINQYIKTNFEVSLYDIDGLLGRAVSILDAKISDVTSAVWEKKDGGKIDISFNADVEVTFLVESVGIDIWGKKLKIGEPYEVKYSRLTDISKVEYVDFSDFLKNAGDLKKWEEKQLMKTKGEAEVEKADGEFRNFRVIFIRPLSKIFGELSDSSL
jgi:hypothetical protein